MESGLIIHSMEKKKVLGSKCMCAQGGVIMNMWEEER